MVEKLDERPPHSRSDPAAGVALDARSHGQPMRATALVRLIRPHQWIKNGFVLIGVLFSHLWDSATLLHALLAFAGFCAMSSAVYVLNDLVDVKADRLHAKKRHRPIASGQIPPPLASAVSVALAVAALTLSWFASPLAMLIVATYAVMNVAYTLRLKHVVIIDVFIISAGFMLRILAGTLGLHIQPSSWLLLCGLMVTLFLGFAKRRAELLSADQQGREARRVLTSYRPEILDQFLSITATCTVLSYALYTVSPETAALHGSINLIYTVPIVLYGIFRYLYLLLAKGSGQDTARDLLNDRHMMVTAAFWLMTTVWILA